MKNPDLTFLEPQTDNSIQSKPVLHADALNGTVLRIAPGSSTPENESAAARVIFVAEGQVTVKDSLKNVILSEDEAMQVPPARKISIRNSGTSAARLFVLELPPRRQEPPLVVM